MNNMSWEHFNNKQCNDSTANCFKIWLEVELDEAKDQRDWTTFWDLIEEYQSETDPNDKWWEH